MVRNRPQDLGLWDPFQMVLIHGYSGVILSTCQVGWSSKYTYHEYLVRAEIEDL